MTRDFYRRAGHLATAGVLLLTGGCAAIPGWAEPETVLIGANLPLTGSGSDRGAVFGNALEMEVARTNERGLLGEDYRLELQVRDSRSTATTAADNLTALAGDSRVRVIVTAGCPDCVIDSADDLAVPVVSLDAEEEVATPAAERHWVFRLGPNAGDNADRLSREIARQEAETVGVIASADRYGDAGVGQMADAAARDGLTIATEQRVAVTAGGQTGENGTGDGDSGAAGGGEGGVAAAEAVAAWRPAGAGPQPGQPPAPAPGSPAGPDAVVIWAQAPLAATIATALREAGYDRPLFLDSLAAVDLFTAGEHDSFDGATMVFTDTPVMNQLIAAHPAAAARKAWFDRYTSRYGSYHLPASWAADAVQLAADAVTRAADEGSADRVTIRDKIESARLEGFTGHIRFTADQHSGLHPSSLALLGNQGNRWLLTG